MANLLLLDPDETAHRALSGILTRGRHRFAIVGTVAAAWDFIRQNVRVDLVFVELKLKEGPGGLAFIERLKADPLLHLVPVVIYTGHGDRDSVKRGLELHVQNFLLKPYHDDVIFSEIAKATANPWYNQHFEEERSFCKMMGYDPETLHKALEALRTALEVARPALQQALELKKTHPTDEHLTLLATQAEAAGAWGIVECLHTLAANAQTNDWNEFAKVLPALEFADRLLFNCINPNIVPQGFLSPEEQTSEGDSRDRALWFDAPAENRCPVISWPQLQSQLEALPGCPVIDSAAASFQMIANGHPSCLNPLMDLVDKDPGLAAQMLIAANKAKRTDALDGSAIEDPRLAIGVLGEVRLASQARSLVTASQRKLSCSPTYSWQQFWMFQIGTARMARYACKALDLPDLAAPAYTAGMLHDLGKLLLLHLHPYGLQAIFEHAREHHIRLGDAERLFLGCSTHEIAVHFSEKQGLPKRFINVMRWIREPKQATEDQELVAVVSLARRLCRHNRVGSSGNKPIDEALPLQDTEEWSLLRNSTFLSFDLRKFEQQVHTECRELKLELNGRMTQYAVA